jgi:hypothetical protein
MFHQNSKNVGLAPSTRHVHQRFAVAVASVGAKTSIHELSKGGDISIAHNFNDVQAITGFL